MAKTERDRCIGLAGMIQAAVLVDSVAREGHCDRQAAAASIDSVFRIDCETADEVYGSLQGVALGLHRLHDQLAGGERFSSVILRYSILLARLDGRLAKRGDLTRKIGDGITSATERLRHFEPMHDNILAQLADIYSETISTMKPRIMVHGEPTYLSSTDNVNLIRSLLLSGIRAARLFHQSGGSWFQTILRRKQYLAQVEALLGDSERRQVKD